MAKPTQNVDITPEEIVTMLQTATCSSIMELAKTGKEAGRESLRSMRNGKEKYAAAGVTVDWRKSTVRSVDTDKLKQLVGEETYEEYFTEQKDLTTAGHFDAMEKIGVLTSEQRAEVETHTSGKRKLYLTDGRELSEDQLLEAFTGFISELLENTND